MTLVGFTGDVFLETGARCVGSGSPSGFCLQKKHSPSRAPFLFTSAVPDSGLRMLCQIQTAATYASLQTSAGWTLQTGK
jgi:hypothetical protein